MPHPALSKGEDKKRLKVLSSGENLGEAFFILLVDKR